MEKIEIFNQLEKEEKQEIINVAYDIVCRKLQQMFIFDYDFQVIKERYIILAMEQKEKEKRRNGNK